MVLITDSRCIVNLQLNGTRPDSRKPQTASEFQTHTTTNEKFNCFRLFQRKLCQYLWLSIFQIIFWDFNYRQIFSFEMLFGKKTKQKVISDFYFVVFFWQKRALADSYFENPWQLRWNVNVIWTKTLILQFPVDQRFFTQTHK